MTIKQAFFSVFRKIAIFCAFFTLSIFAPAHADDNPCRNLSKITTNISATGSGTTTTIYNGIFVPANTQFVENTRYTISMDVVMSNITSSNNGSLLGFYVDYTDGTRSVFQITSDDESGRLSWTTTTGKTVSSIYNFVRNARWTGGTITVSNIQVEKGSTATSYVPYNPLCATCDGIIKTYESAVGTVSQNGTPSPANPIEPVFYTQGDMVLRRVGDYADSYDATTGKITRRVGVKVLDGTENWSTYSATNYLYTMEISNSNTANTYVPYSTHFQGVYGSVVFANIQDGQFKHGSNSTGWYFKATNFETLTNFKSWLAQQYAAGTPVTVYYPLKEASYYTEDWPSSSCIPPIKIATTAYNNNAFSSVQTALNSAVDTIKTVVANTITQTAAIAQIASDKQTRPNSACPAGKTCLLVEDMNGEPHWYEIIEEYIPPEEPETP